MFAALLLAASVATSFLDDFKGTWLCGDQKTPWTIAESGDRWATVTYGASEHPYGIAYVGYLDSEKSFVYNDFHSDGGFAQLSAPEPKNHIYHWTGTFFAVGKDKDPTTDIYWTKLKPDTFLMDFGQMINNMRTPRGSQKCVKA